MSYKPQIGNPNANITFMNVVKNIKIQRVSSALGVQGLTP
jgi:hypothetical protein